MTCVSSNKAYLFRDGYNDGESVIVFAADEAEAQRKGAAELDLSIDDGEVYDCERRPEFDSFADRGFVPAEELIAAGWWFECLGCGHQVNSDMEGEDEDGEPYPLNPVYEDHGVWCTPECKARELEDRRIRKEMQAAAIEDFKRRIHRRFPGVQLIENHSLTPHAYVTSENGVYSLKHVSVAFSFPGQKHGPASLRWDFSIGSGRDPYGPRPPEWFCCNGDREAFEAFARKGQRP